jgi:hypothetical protein
MAAGRLAARLARFGRESAFDLGQFRLDRGPGGDRVQLGLDLVVNAGDEWRIRRLSP